MTTTTLEIREAPVSSVDEAKREITGLAVPWDTDAVIDGQYTERIARGAVQGIEDARLFWRHTEPIGRVIAHRDTDAGLEITAVLSQTPRGEEAYTLLRDGVIDTLSIGFKPIEHAVDPKSGAVVRTAIQVREVSLVPFPAYEDAKVAQVREAATPTPEEARMSETATTTADLEEIRTAIDDMGREISLIQASATTEVPSDPLAQFRSVGEYVKAVASGDEAAARAYTGAVSGDTILKDGWAGNLVEIVKKRRPVLETFSQGVLPAEGMGIEYAVLKSDTTQVTEQEAEGDDLDFGKVAIEIKTAPVKTFGGWTSLSRQAIERSNVGILDTSWEALTEKYARATELYARSLLTGALAWTGSGGTPAALAEVEGDLTTQDGIVALVLELAEHFDNVGRALDGVLVDKATFLAIYGVEATDRILQVSGSPSDKVGTLTVRAGSGEVAGLPFRLLPNAAADTVVAYDRTAIKVLEAPGAPLRLQDENIVNLSKDFSLYGYLSGAVQKPAGLVKVVEPEA